MFKRVLKISTVSGRWIVFDKNNILKFNVLLSPTDFIWKYALNGNTDKVSDNKYMLLSKLADIKSQAVVTSENDEKTSDINKLLV